MGIVNDIISPLLKKTMASCDNPYALGCAIGYDNLQLKNLGN